MEQSHKTFLDDVLNRVKTDPNIQHYLDSGLIKTTTILWGSRYTEEEYPSHIGYTISINDKYKINVNTKGEIYEIIDYIETILPLTPREETKPHTYANVYYHHHTTPHHTTTGNTMDKTLIELEETFVSAQKRHNKAVDTLQRYKYLRWVKENHQKSEEDFLKVSREVGLFLETIQLKEEHKNICPSLYRIFIRMNA